MCGYITGTKKVLVDNGIEVLLEKQKHRGTDGYGAIALYEDGESLHNKYMKAEPLIKWINGLKGNPYVFLHHRATSVGGTKLELAHPLKRNDTILMQNGTNKEPYYMVSEAGSDSDALAILADSMSPENLEKYILDAVGVVIFRKDDKFYLHRDKSRPLLQHESGLMCSEPLIEGTWSLIEEGLDEFTFTEGKLVGLGIMGSVDVDDVGYVEQCGTCKKMHYVPTGYTTCHCCVANGTIQTKDTAWSATNRGMYGNVYDDDDDGYTLDSRNPEVAWEWVNGIYQPKDIKDIGNSEGVYIYEITTTTSVLSEPTIKVSGFPVLLAGNYYLTKGNANSKGRGVFLVTKKLIKSYNAVPYNGGHIPVSPVVPIKLNITDFSAYWNKDVGAFDLQEDVYYLQGDLLGNEDKDILKYNKHMNAYTIPVEYDYTPETYLNWC